MANLVSHVSVPAPDICRAGGASYGGVVAFLVGLGSCHWVRRRVTV